MGAKRPKRPDRNSGNKNDGKSSDKNTSEQDAFLQEIRNRIRRGYYNREDVLEDLSHSFTKAVDIMY